MKFPKFRPQGKDTVPAMLTPGEGVLVPEATQMLGGAKGISFLNRKAKSQARMPLQHFQKGGVADQFVDPKFLEELYLKNQMLGNERDFPTEQELQYQFRDKMQPQHFALGGIAAPQLGGVPTQDPRLAPRGMPDVFARPTQPVDPMGGGQVLGGGPTPAPAPYDPSKFPVGIGGVPQTLPSPTLRQPEPFKPNVDPRSGYGYGMPQTSYFAGGGVAGGNSMEPGDLDQNTWGMNFNGSYYPPDWQGPDNSPNNPQPPYIGYFGNGPNGEPTGSYMPDEYRNYWAHHGGDDGELNSTQRLDQIANSRIGQSGHWDRFRGWVSDDSSGERSGNDRGENSGDVGTSPSSGYLYGTGSNPSQMSAYDPSFPYGSPGASGSGVPTQRGVGLIGNVIGGALGSFIPGGTGLGAKLGGWGARALTRAFQNYGASRQQPGGGSGGGAGGYGTGGGGESQGMGYWGQNPGDNPKFVGWASPERNFSDRGIDPNSPGSFSNGPLSSNPNEPGWTGGTPFGSRTNLSMALPGSFAGLGAGSAGDVSHNFFGNMSTKRLISGGDASLGMSYNDAIPKFARFLSANNGPSGPQGVLLPPSQWGGTANQGTQGGQSSRMGSNQRQMSRE